MLDRDDVVGLLGERGIPFELMTHEAVFAVSEERADRISAHGAHVKNLFLREDRHHTLWLLTVPYDLQPDLKALKRQLHRRSLSLAGDEILWSHLGVRPGSVTPLGLLNDQGHEVTMIFDDRLRGQRIGVHPLVNTETVFLEVEDLVALLQEAGVDVRFMTCPEL